MCIEKMYLTAVMAYHIPDYTCPKTGTTFFGKPTSDKIGPLPEEIIIKRRIELGMNSVYLRHPPFEIRFLSYSLYGLANCSSAG